MKNKIWEKINLITTNQNTPYEEMMKEINFFNRVEEILLSKN